MPTSIQRMIIYSRPQNWRHWNKGDRRCHCPPPVNNSSKLSTTSRSGKTPSRETEVTPHDVVVRCNKLNTRVNELQIQLHMKNKEARYLQSKLILINELSVSPVVEWASSELYWYDISATIIEYRRRGYSDVRFFIRLSFAYAWYQNMCDVHNPLTAYWFISILCSMLDKCCLYFDSDG